MYFTIIPLFLFITNWSKSKELNKEHLKALQYIVYTFKKKESCSKEEVVCFSTFTKLGELTFCIVLYKA